MSELLRFFKDMRDNGYGLAEIAAQLGTSAIAEPVAGFAAMYDPAHGADAIREGMTYQPRSDAAKMYQRGAANAIGQAVKPAMPIIDTWKKGVDIAGQYSPVVGAGLRTVPMAIGIAMGAKPALQAGRQVSKGLESMQGRMIANANAPRTLNTGYMGQRGVFAGINALTADRQALAKAQDMIARGVDPAEVWKETGWGKGVDGKWRFEINDKYDITDNLDEIGSRFPIDDEITRNLISGRWNGARSTDMLSHDDLYAAYPEFKNMGIAKETGDSLGSINHDGTQAYINTTLLQRSLGGRDISKPDNAHSVLMHEIQHAIQGKEGFARGGSPQTVNQSIFRENQAKYFDDLITQLEEKLPKPNQQWIDDIHDPIEAQIEKIKEQKYNLSNSNVGFDAYRSLAGEVEARTTQSRMDLNAQQRRENYPFDYKTYGYDVPAKSQTVDFGNNKANAQRPLTEFEQAHLTAQRNAALPVEKGGLGLPADNTAMDRARAMGFDVEAYHTSRHGIDVDSLDSGKYAIAPFDAIGTHFGTKEAALDRFNRTVGTTEQFKGSTYPVLLKGSNPLLSKNGQVFNEEPLMMSLSEKADYGNLSKSNALQREQIFSQNSIIPYINDVEMPGSTSYIAPPSSIRSRFAAFDPFNRDSSNLLATTAPLVPTTALGAYMYNEKRKKSQGNQ